MLKLFLYQPVEAPNLDGAFLCGDTTYFTVVDIDEIEGVCRLLDIIEGGDVCHKKERKFTTEERKFIKSVRRCANKTTTGWFSIPKTATEFIEARVG